MRAPPGRAGTTSSALVTSIPTYTSSAIARLLPGRPTLPCPMRARACGTARSTVRVTDALASGRGDPCSPAACSDPGSFGLPRPLLSWYAGSQIQGSLLAARDGRTLRAHPARGVFWRELSESRECDDHGK